MGSNQKDMRLLWRHFHDSNKAKIDLFWKSFLSLATSWSLVQSCISNSENADGLFLFFFFCLLPPEAKHYECAVSAVVTWNVKQCKRFHTHTRGNKSSQWERGIKRLGQHNPIFSLHRFWDAAAAAAVLLSPRLEMGGEKKESDGKSN